MLRELRDADVPAVVALINRLEPHWVMNEAGFRHGVATRPARLRYLRLVAEEGGEIVAWAAASIFAYAESPDSGGVTVNVREDRRRRGIGGALLEQCLAHLETVGLSRVRASALDEDGRRFLESRGFSYASSYRLSQLDPRDVDVSGLRELRERKAAEGFTVVPISVCRAEDVHRVEEASMRDTPTDEPITHMPFDEWVALHWQSPLLTRDGSFAVLHDGRPVTLSMLHVDSLRRLAENAGTGTLREFRRRGLALLAKLCQVQWAAASGITAVVTDNDETNAGMLAINEQLGYRPLAEVRSFVRELR